MHYKKILGQNVSLTPITLDDAEKWAEWLNDLEVTLPLGDEAYSLITTEGMREDINWFLTNKQHVFSILHNETNTPIGRCLLFNVNTTDRTAMLGIFIGDKQYWGKGYGKEAICLLLDYAFNLLNLNSIMLGVYSFNERAINCYKSVGFKEIGRRRQARIIGQNRYDGILMDILAEEFTGNAITQYTKQL